MFQKAVLASFNTLDATRSGRNTTAIDQARAALETKWREALQDLERRRADFAQRAAAFQELVIRSWVLPTRLTPALEAAKTSLNDSLAIQQRDVAGASEQLDNTRTALVVQLHERGVAWQEESRSFFAAVLDQLEGRFNRIRVALKAALESWRAQSPSFSKVPEKTDANNNEQFLQRLHGEYRHAKEMATTLTDRLHQELKEALAAAADASSWKSVREEVSSLKELLANAVEEPKASVDSVIASIIRLHAVWEQAARVEPGVSPGVLLGGSLTDFGGIEPFPVIIGGAPRRDGASIFAGGLSTPDLYGADILEAESSVWRAKLQQSVIVGLLFVVWALATYSPTFDGTWAGLATVFFSVFSADVAVDSLLTKMKR